MSIAGEEGLTAAEASASNLSPLQNIAHNPRSPIGAAYLHLRLYPPIDPGYVGFR